MGIESIGEYIRSGRGHASLAGSGCGRDLDPGLLGGLRYSRSLSSLSTTVPPAIMPKAVLTYESGDEAGPSHEFEQPQIRIGRGSENDLVTPPETSVVSREQCLIFFHDGYYWIEDLASRHGTFVNDEPLTVQQMLVEGDAIRFGMTGPVLRFHWER